MGFFTFVFIFIFVLLFLIWIVKYPILGVLLLIGAVVAAVVNCQNSKNKEETVKQSIERIRQDLEKISFKVNQEIYLTCDKTSRGLVYSELIIDFYNQQIAICDFLKNDLKIIPFQNLVNCEIVENDETIRSFVGTPDKDSKLMIGGMVSKEIKPIVNNLFIKIETSNPNNSVIFLPLITKPINRKEYEYKKARDIASHAYFAIAKIL